MRPFKPGDKLEDHAVPMAEVMLQLQTQLAEFRALKEQLGTDPAANLRAHLTSFADTMSSQRSDTSNVSSASSSRIHLASPDSSDLHSSDYRS